MANIRRALQRWKEVIIIIIFIRCFLFITTLTIHPQIDQLFNSWVQWDGLHYIDIARNWYQATGEKSLWIVFYPLYPILIRLINFLINDFPTSAVVVSLIFSFISSILLFEITLLDFSKRAAILAVWFLNIFPTAYFLQASYTESLYLSVSLATIYLFRKKYFILAGLTGALSTMCRINGLLLLPTLLLEGRKKREEIITLLLIPLGFLFYLLINYLTFNDPFYFLKPLSSNWHKEFSLPWIGISNLLSSMPKFNDPLFYAYLAEVTVLLLIASLGIYVFFKIRKSYGIYMFLNFLLFTSTSFVISTPRYSLILFPIFIILGQIKSKYLLLLISIIFFLPLVFFTILYTLGRWAF